MRYLEVREAVDSISITHSFDRKKLIFLNTSDVLNGSIINRNWMNVENLKGQAKKTIKNGDILFSEIRPKNKRFAYVNVENEEDYVVSTKLMVLRNNNPDVIQRYFYYFITSESMLNYLQMRAESRIGSFPQITYSLFANYKFPVPTLKRQQEIVDRLDTITNKMELNTKIINDFEEYSHLLFHKWFVDFNFPNENCNPYKDSGGEMVEIDGKMLPYGWKRKVVDELVEKIIDHRGKTPKKLGGDWVDEGIIALSAKIVKGGHLINLEKANQVSEEMYLRWMKDELKDGDILMTSEAPLGEFYFIIGQEKYCLSQRLFALRADNEVILSSYLYLELSQPRGIKNIIARQSGSTVFGIRQGELRKVCLVVPPLEIQKKFQDKILPILKKIRNCEIENRLLAETRELLIKKLIK